MRKSKGAVEVVEYKGIKFRRYPDSKRWSDRQYYRPGPHIVARGVEALHREVWKDNFGPIPSGHHVHHKDGNTANNDPSNLECIPGPEHQSYHGRHVSPEHKEKCAKHLDKVRHLAAEWHGSRAGLAWHRANGKRVWENRQPIVRICDQCGREFSSLDAKPSTRFCSNNCKSAWRRQSGVDNEERRCIECGGVFAVNKYEKNKYCSRECAARGRRSRSASSL